MTAFAVCFLWWALILSSLGACVRAMSNAAGVWPREVRGG